MNLFDLNGQTAVVIGGNSTLGSVMVEALGAYGASVAIVGRNEKTCEEVQQKMSGQKLDTKVFLADITNTNQLQSLLHDVINWRHSIDILINCAGVNSPTPFLELEMEEWDHIMQVNLRSVVEVCQKFGKHMISQGKGGSIINISSVSSDPPLSRVFTYSASKAGINSITKFLACEWAPHQIRVNAIIPGFFPAEQNRKILTEERTDAILKHTPMRRFGDPKELQGAVLYLASNAASSFVTGSLMRVDGGFGAMTI